MELKKYKLGDIAEIYISSIDKKSKEGEQSVRLALRARSRHEKIISLHVVFESRHT